MDIEKVNVTPIHRLNEQLNNNNFYIKRDDLIPISFGGNKARKAVLFFKDINLKGANCVVTYGSSSSNHCRIIANIAAAKGLPCYIISPDENSTPTTNSKLIEIFGSKVIQCRVHEVSAIIDKKIEELKDRGYKPYFIPGGGHGIIGTQAYVDAYQEIVQYEKETGIYFDYIFHTSGTGSTQAGLICGQLIKGDPRKIVGIGIARKNTYGGQVVLKSVNDYLRNLGKKEITADFVEYVDDYVLDGYGSFNDEIIMTIKEVLIRDSIPLDKTYTGKGYWGMREYIKKNHIKDKNILFIHTGGTPLFFDVLGELNK